MKCERCNSKFALKELTKGCCPSCGAKLQAAAYCNDSKEWLWYLYHSSIPHSIIFAYIYLIGGGMLALAIVMESVGLGLWDVMRPVEWMFLVAASLIFLLPFFAIFFMPSARKWRVKLREDGLVYKNAVKSGKLSLRKYRLILASLGFVVTVGLLWCISEFCGQTTTSHCNHNGQAVGMTTRYGNFGQ